MHTQQSDMPKPIDSSLPETQVVVNPMLEKRSRRQFSAEYKLHIIAQTEQCQRRTLGALLRREHVYKPASGLAQTAAVNKLCRRVRQNHNQS